MPKHHSDHIVYFELTVGEIETITHALREQMKRTEILGEQKPHLQEIAKASFYRLNALEEKLYRLVIIPEGQNV